MTHVNASNVVQFSYRAFPETIFTQMTGTHCAAPLGTEMLPIDGLTDVSVFQDDQCHARTGTLLSLAREDAAYRPKVWPVRLARKPADGSKHMRGRSASAEGQPVCPTHPAHLLIVSARRARPARLCANQPVAVAMAAARCALYPEVPVSSGAPHALRTIAHSVAIVGLFMSVAQTAAAQQMLSLF